MFSPKLEPENLKKLVDQLRFLYVIRGDKYLIQTPGGNYKTYIRYSNAKRPLLPYMLENHLKQKYTVGVFSGNKYSKFICFDIDYENPKVAKKVTYKVAETINHLGISKYYISHSGSKGYHIEIFVSDLIDLKSAKKFFNLVLYESDILNYSDQGEIEFRPSNLGVKLPLGLNQKHYKTGGYCGFCLEKQDLEMIEDEEEEIEYFLSIQKINRDRISEIIKKKKDFFKEIDKKINDNKKSTLKSEIRETEQATINHTGSGSYYQSEDDPMEKAIDFYYNGLKKTGTRHNACFLIALLLKYNGFTKEESYKQLFQWLKCQDKTTYKTSFEDAVRDINEVVEYVYKKDCNPIPSKKNLTISLSEINAIITKCPEKNQKLLVYALLVHSKRFANKEGVFFMTYHQMQVSSGLSRRTVIRQINKLENLGVLKVVERNEKERKFSQKFNKPLSEPNKYKLLIKTEKKKYNDRKNKIEEDFPSCLMKFYSKEYLKSFLPKKQYRSFVQGL